MPSSILVASWSIQATLARFVGVLAVLMAFAATPADAATFSGSCAIKPGGQVVCEGWPKVYPSGPRNPGPLQPIAGVSDAVAVAGSGEFGCAVRRAGALKCWGADSSGQLGIGQRPRFDTRPVAPLVLTDARDVSVSVSETAVCATRSAGGVACWGASGGYGSETNIPGSTVPIRFGHFSDAVTIKLGQRHHCVIRTAGKVSCWGEAAAGQLGGGTTNRGITEVLGLDGVTSIGLGTSHTCARRDDGSVWCWGSNAVGQLGAGSLPPTSPARSLRPVRVAGIDDAVAVSARADHTCALLERQRVTCWGSARLGELPLQDQHDHPEPTPIPALDGTEAIADDCMLRAGAVRCIGGVFASKGPATTPVDVLGLSDAAQVSTASGFACATRRGGKVACWGSGVPGLGSPFQAGDYLRDEPTPFEIVGISDAVEVATDVYESCARLADRTVRCWRQGGFNGFGDPNPTFTAGNVTIFHPPVDDVVDLDVGELVPCVVRADGSVWCLYGTPERTAGIGDAVAVAVGRRHRCAVRAAGAVVCWGDDVRGQLGDGPTVNRSNGLVVVDGISDATSISAAGNRTCVVRRGGRVSCWGNYKAYSYEGDHEVGAPSPVAVDGLTDAVDVDVAGFHACATRAEGHMVCWGVGRVGQLGNGATLPATSPVTVAGLDDAVDGAAAGTNDYSPNDASCAVRRGGGVRCWGAGDSGQLGDGGAPTGHYPWEGRVRQQAYDGTLLPPVSATRAPAVTGPTHVGLRLTCDRGVWTGRPLALSRQWLRDGAPILGATGGTLTTGAADVGHELRCRVRASVLSGAVEATSEAVVIIDPAAGGAVPPPGAARVAVGTTNACAVRGTAVACLGTDAEGELGNGPGRLDRTVASEVAGLSARAVVAGDAFACAITTGRRVACWGRGAAGRIGEASTPAADVPIPVAGLSDVRDLAAGGRHVCALRGDGTVLCWGTGTSGQLGDGTTVSRIAPTSPVAGLTDAVAIATGGGTSCAVRSAGQVLCWGSRVGSSRPMAVGGFTDAVGAAVGRAHLCALRATGGVSCWGDGASGQLGDGAATRRTTPVAAALPSGAVASTVAAGFDRSCAVADGTAYCWGAGAASIGDAAPSADALVPTAVAGEGASNSTAVATGPARVCVITQPPGISGRLRCVDLAT